MEVWPFTCSASEFKNLVLDESLDNSVLINLYENSE